MQPFTLASVAAVFQWRIPPLEWSCDPAGGLTILAGAQTDWFADPAGEPTRDTAPCALAVMPDDHFLLSARVAVDFAAPFDAGVLQLRAAADRWAKLCFEFSPQRRPMIVSVVTRGVSDDCNSAEVEGSPIHLRVACTPQTQAFHYSHDGRVWHLVRYFSLGPMANLRVGFSAQSPSGRKCAAIFSDIRYRPGTLRDNRNGE